MIRQCNLTLTFNKKGFSLLEVLISVTLLSFIMLGVISVTGDSMNTKDRVIEEDKENLQIEMAMNRFEWDFSQIYSPLYFSNRYQKPYVPPGQKDTSSSTFSEVMSRYRSNKRFPFPNQDGLPVPNFENPEKSTFIFFSTSNRRKRQEARESHFAWIKYTLESPENPKENQTGKDLVRYFIPEDPFKEDEIEWSNYKGFILMENVMEMNFTFWDPEKKKFTDSLETIKDGKHLIRGVKVYIKWIDATGFEREDERIFRPLWPEFIPEDLNKLAQEDYKKQTNDAKNNQPSNVTTNDDPGGSN